DALSDSADAARIDKRRDVAMRVDVDKAGADDLTGAVDRGRIDRCEIAHGDDSFTADTDVHLAPGRAAAVDHLPAAQNHVHCEIGPPPVRMYTVDSLHEAPERVGEGSRVTFSDAGPPGPRGPGVPQALRITMTVNGRQLPAQVDPTTLLVHVIRDSWGLSGAK